ncbi:MAG: phage portal protein, partial [Huintestinicola sp.]
IEPVLLKMSRAYENRIFTRRMRGCGNNIIFESYNLACASMNTKLNLREMVDRGAMTPNEWRAAFNMAPVPGGDKLLLRKDTGIITEEGGENDENN